MHFAYCLHSCDQPPSTGSSAPVVKVASNARKRTAFAIAYEPFGTIIGAIAAISAPSGHRFSSCCGRETDARDLDDGLPRGFLAGAIVEVWMALRLNWA